MSKKLLALIILLVVVLGLYGSYYIYVTAVIVPEDLKVLKSEYKGIPDQGVLNNSEINELNKTATQIENGNSLKTIPKSERQKIANDLRSQIQPYESQVQEIKQNFTNNNEIALKYDLILKGNVANELRSAYNESKLSLFDKFFNATDDMAKDYEKGDNKALANDMREFIGTTQQINNWSATAKLQLRDIIEQLDG
jgi:hypothetical protein